MSSDLQAELKQSKPFSSLEEEVFLRIVRTADRLQYDLGQLLKQENLTTTQYNALRILRGAGERGLPCHEIGERMITKVPDVTRLLDRLEQQGLVFRNREKEDRRVVRARIEPKGLDILARLDQPIDEFHRQQLQHMGDDKLNQVNNLLRHMRRPRGA